MRHYNNQLEYIADICNLVELLLNAYKNRDISLCASALDFRDKIKERANAEIFIPLEHIIQAFSLSEIEEHLLFIIFVCDSHEEFKTEFLKNVGITRLTALAIEALALFFSKGSVSFFSLQNLIGHVLYNNAGEYTLKSEISRFIFEPGKIVERPWLEFYYPGEEQNLIFDEGITEGLSRLVDDCLSRQITQVIAVKGRPGAGRSSLIRCVAGESGLPVLFVNCKLIAQEDLSRIADEMKTECLLAGAIICFRSVDAIKEPEKLSALMWGIRSASRLVFATAENEQDLNFAYDCELIEYSLPLPSVDVSVRLWAEQAREINISADLYRLANSFRFTPMQIKQAAKRAHAITLSQGAEKITQSELSAACRDISAKRVGALGQIISPSFKWKDLVLPPEREKELISVLERIKLRKIVFGDWGFDDKTPYGAGVHVLLYGPSGTGKTMAARIIAAELGLSIYQIDMASVVSKYIGETEKNLNKIFEEGENSNSVLFFDEADALFGKRTQIKDAHDRHANLQVAFLLQKIEKYSGVTILATNFIKNFDEAFKRRFHFMIGFSMPDMQLREKIWRNAFPAKAPLANDLDFRRLSEFSMSGSAIKNAALASAFYAAQRGEPIAMNDILNAIRDEASKDDGGFAEEFFEDCSQ